MEEALSATAGDLAGGEIAPDQMFAFRPASPKPARARRWTGSISPGPSSAAGPLATGAAGTVAAEALLADLRAGRLP